MHFTIQREALLQMRWMLEELRVSVFAPELKTPMPISARRIMKHLEKNKLA